MAHLDHQPDSLPVRHTRTFPLSYRRIGKRTLDLVLTMLALPLVLPVIAVLWLAARVEGGTGFFAHRRIGRDGRAFTCWKIRTMVPDAERKLARYLADCPAARVEWARTHKLANDPRITPLGRFLRRTSLDELPQVWNVLRGEMSLVGPRPITKPELYLYGLDAPLYLSLRPGLTGMWQVTGRTDGCYLERLRLDQAYAQGLSLWQDLRLIARTLFIVVLRPTGR